MDTNLNQAFETVEKALRPEVTREQLYAVTMALHEAIESLIDDECDMEGEMESEGSGESEDSGEMMPGMMEAMGKMDGQTDLEIEEENGTYATKSWGGVFSPISFKK